MAAACAARCDASGKAGPHSGSSKKAVVSVATMASMSAGVAARAGTGLCSLVIAVP
ncbi:hypothetical protein ABZ341_20390 [Streptomyces sp. NPDC006173]|uniref:hypothetical protein n=1 Tax=Streptomyces sp. NPDC006173 TaxID=3155349 RepID=UPI0034088997